MTVQFRPAKPSDVRDIAQIVAPYANRRILVSKELISYFEDVQEFVVATDDGGDVVGCGALHVLWDDLAEVRTLAVAEPLVGHGIGHGLLTRLERRARDLGLRRLFCLTFEVDFFGRHGFYPIEGTPVGTDIYQEMLRSHDDGVAEFLDLARVKPNTLGNTRMLKELS
ncbi:MAG: amino-acid N-acetyltransferase [Ancrocorticia sp.]|nr:amino-acid N-acetyltransferase [Ancrocorticia sp.]MCI1895581.1 amino-acid N-acetyltransferase [Ancrocorticia sp.]MCI1932314.1 amino-acid N-acetyltransferase [Ancrocorticia sp.]MCI1962775.1 amino-acid N-acetyltransferase [Ancrocorticia sp.]MCI2001945.1 amino-acid N-acetyltransferase [Ancrocorticia sp.]